MHGIVNEKIEAWFVQISMWFVLQKAPIYSRVRKVIQVQSNISVTTPQGEFISFPHGKITFNGKTNGFKINRKLQVKGDVLEMEDLKIHQKWYTGEFNWKEMPSKERKTWNFSMMPKTFYAGQISVKHMCCAAREAVLFRPNHTSDWARVVELSVSNCTVYELEANTVGSNKTAVRECGIQTSRAFLL